MNCPSCQAANPEGAKFCTACGSALAVECPHCQTLLPAEAAFCSSCGNKLTAAPEAPTSSAEDPLRQFIPPELLAKLESSRRSGEAGP